MCDRRKVIIPVFVPHKGCPNDCVFCNQRKITGCAEPAGPEDVVKAVELRMDTVDTERNQLELAFFGGSFTMIPEKEQVALLEKAGEYLKAGFLKTLRISTRPDGINEEVLQRLKKYGVSIVELGVQSMDEEVLKRSKRGYSPEQVAVAINLLKKEGFQLGVQVMTGLPGSTLEKEIHTAESLCALKPQIARIYPTLVIKDTELEADYLNGSFTPLTLKEAVEASYEMLKVFEKNKVQVIRIGLQPTDGIAAGKDVVAGPFHPSFGELVEGRIYRDKVENLIEDEIENRRSRRENIKESKKKSTKESTGKITKENAVENTVDSVKESTESLAAGKSLLVYCENKLVSKVSGHHRANKDYFMEKYGFREVRIKSMEELVEDMKKNNTAKMSELMAEMCLEKGLAVFF